jgi:LacI family transcriptional regulator
MARKKATRDTNLTIALVCRQDCSYSTGIVRGIGRYARRHDNWALVLVVPSRRLGEALRALKPAGVIVNNEIDGTADVLRKIGRPVVNTMRSLPDPRFYQVTIDDASVGCRAANHLLECGLKNFGYFGHPWMGDDAGREGSFCRTLQNLSYTVSACYVFPRIGSTRGGTYASEKDICRWLAQLPKPCGVFASYDAIALQLCGICRREGIKVPEEVAIVGVDNDELLCELSQPSISSVPFPAECIGYEAAAVLDRLMHQELVPNKRLLLPVTGVIARQSTDILVGVESVILEAVQFIREHISEPITVDDIVRHARLSRRSFYRKFHEAMGRNPAQEIRRVRIATAKALLAGNTRMKTESVAKRCGFTSTVQFFTSFHQATGMTPADYRRAMGQEGAQSNLPANTSANASAKRL